MSAAAAAPGRAPCPLCGADQTQARADCWLCRHPIPARALARQDAGAPALPENPDLIPRRTPPPLPTPPPPPLASDAPEFNLTGTLTFAVLTAAVLGAFAISFDAGFVALLIGLIPLCATGKELFVGPAGEAASAEAAADQEAPGVAPLAFIFKALGWTIAVVVLVPVALCVALAATCTVIIGVASLVHP